MADINPTSSVIALNANGLNIPVNYQDCKCVVWGIGRYSFLYLSIYQSIYLSVI
jgi:hypothetical protein